MNLARHAAVIWRFRRISAAGLLLGIFLAVFASYTITTSGLKQRGVSTYSSRSQLLVTQPGFPDGRPVLPTTQTIDPATGKPIIDPTKTDFADPARFLTLADLYTKQLTSDDILHRLPARVSPTQIVASPLPAVSGAPILPIIQLDTIGATPKAARQLNLDLGKALRQWLQENQAKNGIPPAKRVVIETMDSPEVGALTSGPSKTASVLALLLVLIATVALTHLLENLRTRRDAAQLDELDVWTAVDDQDAAAAKRNGSSEHVHAGLATADWGPPVSRGRRSE
jgi:hypothetical protein